MSQAARKPAAAQAALDPAKNKSTASGGGGPAIVPQATKATGASSAPPSAQPMKSTAMEFFRLAKAEVSIADAQAAASAPQLQPKAEMFKELVASAQPAVRLGIISKCALSGHDCHLLDETNNIMAHFTLDQDVPPGFEDARKHVQTMPNTIRALVVYTDRLEALLSNGSTVPFP